MKKVLIGLLLCSVTMSAYAQKKTKNEKIIQLLDEMGTTKTLEQAMGTMIGSFKETFKTVPTEFWDQFMKEINLKELQTLIIPVYDKHYTETDIDQLIAFYNTPVGKKTINSLPAIMQESMEIGQVWGRAIGFKAYEKVKEKGYIKE